MSTLKEALAATGVFGGCVVLTPAHIAAAAVEDLGLLGALPFALVGLKALFYFRDSWDPLTVFGGGYLLPVGLWCAVVGTVKSVVSGDGDGAVAVHFARAAFLDAITTLWFVVYPTAGAVGILWFIAHRADVERDYKRMVP